MEKGSYGIKVLLFGLVFVILGGFLLFLGINRMVRMNAGKYVETQAKITKIETTMTSDEDGVHEDHQITVEYEVEGKKYVSILSENPSKFYEGMELKVLYDVDKPTTVVLPGKTSSYIMMVIGAVAILIGAVVMIKSRKCVE